MAFGKTITAKPLNLGKAARGKVGFIAILGHAAQKPVFKIADIAMLFERRKRASQPVSLFWGKARTDNGNLHRLFLKQRHAKGFAQHCTQRIRGERHLLLFVAAADIGMHHITLDRTGTHNRHLDDQIIKRAWLHPWQEIHLRPALDLKHPDTIGAAQHIIDFRILLRQRRQRIARAVMLGHQIKCLTNTTQHAKAQYIDLENTQSIDVILVPTNDCAILHCGVLDRHQFVKPALGNNKATNMLAEMTGKADNVFDQRHGPLQMAIGRIEADLPQAVILQPVTSKKSP